MSNPENKHYVSEDESAGYASPLLDISAAIAIAILALWVMVMSWALKVPDTVATAPGLLPFITAVMLLGMALVLGIVAWRRHRAAPASIAQDIPADLGRVGFLVSILIAYVACLEFFKFDAGVTVGGLRLEIGAFEPISIIVMTIIFRVFWTDRLWACFVVATGWIFFLSTVFRQVMSIPMPS